MCGVCAHISVCMCVRMLYLIGIVFHSALTDYNRNCKTKPSRARTHTLNKLTRSLNQIERLVFFF